MAQSPITHARWRFSCARTNHRAASPTQVLTLISVTKLLPPFPTAAQLRRALDFVTSNSILYHLAEDSYTIGDRNPNLYVKVTRAGSPVWQIGGSCTGALAAKCAAGSWKVNTATPSLTPATC